MGFLAYQVENNSNWTKFPARSVGQIICQLGHNKTTMGNCQCMGTIRMVVGWYYDYRSNYSICLPG